MAAASSSGNNPAPALPRKGAYSKHIQSLHKDQMSRLQAKNSQEIDLLEQIKSFAKQKAALDKSRADGMLKLCTAQLNHKLAAIPDIQKGDEDRVCVCLSCMCSTACNHPTTYIQVFRT